MRLGMRLVKGLSANKVQPLVTARRDSRFATVAELARRSGVPRGVLARLAAADAFGSMGLSRRDALWQVLAVRDEPLPLFAGQEPRDDEAALPAATLAERVIQDYDAVGLSLNAHPIALIRPELNARQVMPAKDVMALKQGAAGRVAGLVLVRQRPPTASGIVFMTLEDETGIANLIVPARVYERFRKVAHGAVALVADGRITRQGEVVHVRVSHLRDLAQEPASPRVRSRNFQ